MAKLKVGDRAPHFAATTMDGSTIRLTDFLGKRGIVLFFYPKNGTSVCTKEACSFRDSYDKFRDAGAEVIGVSSDSAESHVAFAEQNHLRFPLISDHDRSLAKLFGVPDSFGLIPKRVTFVIDKSGIIRLIFSALFASHEHVQRAREACQALAMPEAPRASHR
jgi:peroxiredoxin Q/BCP